MKRLLLLAIGLFALLIPVSGQVSRAPLSRASVGLIGSRLPITTIPPREDGGSGGEDPPPTSTQWRLNAEAADGGSSIAMSELSLRETVGGADAATGGTATASTSFSGSFLPANAFDDNASTLWSSATGSPQWIAYEFATAVEIVEYVIQARPSSQNTSPRRWTLEYWDGDEWVLYDRQWNETGWTAGEIRTFQSCGTGNVPGDEDRWRLNITAQGGGSSLSIAEVEMRSVVGGSDRVGCGDVSADAASSGLPAYQALDDDAATVWSKAGSSGWWEFEFIAPINVVQYAIQAHPGNPENTPTAWTLEHWNGSSWDVVDTRSGETGWTSGEVRTYSVGG